MWSQRRPNDKAEKHGLVTGYEMQNWQEAERGINALRSSTGTSRGNHDRSSPGNAAPRIRPGENPLQALPQCGPIHNISPDGMFILCEAVADVSASVDISIAVSGEANASVRIPGIVVHRRRNGFGIMFRELDGTALKFVGRLLGRGKGKV